MSFVNDYKPRMAVDGMAHTDRLRWSLPSSKKKNVGMDCITTTTTTTSTSSTSSTSAHAPFPSAALVLRTRTPALAVVSLSSSTSSLAKSMPSYSALNTKYIHPIRTQCRPARNNLLFQPQLVVEGRDELARRAPLCREVHNRLTTRALLLIHSSIHHLALLNNNNNKILPPSSDFTEKKPLLTVAICL